MRGCADALAIERTPRTVMMTPGAATILAPAGIVIVAPAGISSGVIPPVPSTSPPRPPAGAMAPPEHPATSKITVAPVLRCMGAGYRIAECAALPAARQ